MKKTKPKIILVEDDSDIAELIELVLVREGFEIFIFEEGQSALKKITPNKTDLIIMDLWIPGIDGATLTKKLKADKALAKIPVILISAHNSLAKVAKQALADGYLAKPFNIKDLLSIVKKFIK